MASNTALKERLQPQTTVDKDGILVTKEIANKTVWDTLAVENPTHAVISAKDEASAAEKSKEQIENIKSHINPGDVLLDCGTGYGRVAKYLLPQQKLGGYIGVDSAYQMLQLFQKRYQSEPAEQETPLLLLNADIHTLPLNESSVDVAIVCAVYLHNNKEIVSKAVAELKRAVTPGGRVLVYSSFPNGGSLMGLQGYMYQILLNLIGQPYKNGPVRYYTKREVASVFDGFEEVDIIPTGFAVFPKTLIFLPDILEKIYRIGIANPINFFLGLITPNTMKQLFCVHYDVVAKR